MDQCVIARRIDNGCVKFVTTAAPTTAAPATTSAPTAPANSCIHASDTTTCLTSCKNSPVGELDSCVDSCVRDRMIQRGCDPVSGSTTRSVTTAPVFVGPVPEFCNTEREKDVPECSRICNFFSNGMPLDTCMNDCIVRRSRERGCPMSSVATAAATTTAATTTTTRPTTTTAAPLTSAPTVACLQPQDAMECVNTCRSIASGDDLDVCSDRCIHKRMVQRGCVTLTTASATTRPVSNSCVRASDTTSCTKSCAGQPASSLSGCISQCVSRHMAQRGCTVVHRTSAAATMATVAATRSAQTTRDWRASIRATTRPASSATARPSGAVVRQETRDVLVVMRNCLSGNSCSADAVRSLEQVVKRLRTHLSSVSRTVTNASGSARRTAKRELRRDTKLLRSAVKVARRVTRMEKTKVSKLRRRVAKCESESCKRRNNRKLRRETRILRRTRRVVRKARASVKKVSSKVSRVVVSGKSARQRVRKATLTVVQCANKRGARCTKGVLRVLKRAVSKVNRHVKTVSKRVRSCKGRLCSRLRRSLRRDDRVVAHAVRAAVNVVERGRKVLVTLKRRLARCGSRKLCTERIQARLRKERRLAASWERFVMRMARTAGNNLSRQVKAVRRSLLQCKAEACAATVATARTVRTQIISMVQSVMSGTEICSNSKCRDSLTREFNRHHTLVSDVHSFLQILRRRIQRTVSSLKTQSKKCNAQGCRDRFRVRITTQTTALKLCDSLLKVTIIRPNGSSKTSATTRRSTKSSATTKAPTRTTAFSISRCRKDLAKLRAQKDTLLVDMDLCEDAACQKKQRDALTKVRDSIKRLNKCRPPVVTTAPALTSEHLLARDQCDDELAEWNMEREVINERLGALYDQASKCPNATCTQNVLKQLRVEHAGMRGLVRPVCANRFFSSTTKKATTTRKATTTLGRNRTTRSRVVRTKVATTKPAATSGRANVVTTQGRPNDIPSAGQFRIFR